MQSARRTGEHKIRHWIFYLRAQRCARARAVAANLRTRPAARARKLFDNNKAKTKTTTTLENNARPVRETKLFGGRFHALHLGRLSWARSAWTGLGRRFIARTFRCTPSTLGHLSGGGCQTRARQSANSKSGLKRQQQLVSICCEMRGGRARARVIKIAQRRSSAGESETNSAGFACTREIRSQSKLNQPSWRGDKPLGRGGGGGGGGDEKEGRGQQRDFIARLAGSYRTLVSSFSPTRSAKSRPRSPAVGPALSGEICHHFAARTNQWPRRRFGRKLNEANEG